MRSFKSLLIVIFCATVLAACGLKGPLYLPDDHATSGSATQQSSDTDKSDTDNKTHTDAGN